MSTGTLQRAALKAACVTVALALVAALAGCGGGSTDRPDGIDISSGSRHLNLVAYATPKVGFDMVIPGFRATPEGHDVGFSQSYGASGDQSRKVARGLPADVVNFSVEPDITRLVDAGVVDEDWQQQAPNDSIPFGSVVALVVRQGNPKNIHTWDDLLRPGIEVVTPNPGSSGSAKWNLLAPYAAKSDGGRNPQAGLDYVSALVRDHVKVLPKSGREATSAFQQGQGDVLISYENEAIMLSRKNASSPPADRIDYIVPSVTFKIENPVAVVNTSTDPAAARAFVRYLFSTPGQKLWAEAGFRPVDPDVARQTAHLFPGDIRKEWTVADLGGWKKVDKQLFGNGGEISEIYAREAGR
ncbi:sulfate ABC transporter substrate-binding protein [Gordonia sp. LUNF6]|uniref:sulfate ABC transporter substrate-binding protein n=1 Tax=Gordonia TaxID=2053 RepID=UPI0005EE1495|nr:sulfate ABC transporter substrate-binding protein [Gordonia sihwensis]MBY4571071.1 sulfate ABC transporter substrate-binding protein [Gordonia sihwensis]WFN91716.1 sulfate ABC transporter substrate-binding protein [Gordonia sihwensis]